jgi:hypothetical protein
MRFIITALLCLFLCTNALAESPLPWVEEEIVMSAIHDVKIKKKQSIHIMSVEEIKEFAFITGEQVELGETMRAITFLETRFGEAGRIGDKGKARGVTQIQISTARFILKELMDINLKFTDLEIKWLLTKNDRLCIIMSKNYLVYLMDKFRNEPGNWSHGVLSYNVGPTGVSKFGIDYDPNNYVDKAKRFIKKERKYD